MQQNFIHYLLTTSGAKISNLKCECWKNIINVLVQGKITLMAQIDVMPVMNYKKTTFSVLIKIK